MNKRLVERIGMAAVIAAFVAYFCYQVAYGVSETVTNGNITATMTAPPGSNITGLKIVPEGTASNFTIKNYSSVNIANSTWTMDNSTSGSVSTIKFKFFILTGKIIHYIDTRLKYLQGWS